MLGYLFQSLTVLMVKISYLVSILDFSCLNTVSLLLVLSQVRYPCGEPDCLLTSLYRQTLAVKVSPKSSLLQAESAQLLLPLLIGQVLWLLEHLVGYCVRVLGVLLVLGGSKTRCIRPCLE